MLAVYAATFISRRDMYPVQVENGTYVTIQKTLSENLIAAHLKGYITIGAYALDPNGWAKWLCFDADDELHWKSLNRMAKRLESYSIQPYLEPSRRGGHLWLFTPSLPGIQARRFGKQLLKDYKLKGVELYPKQDLPATGPGSLVRLPLGIHRLTGKRYHFINSEGEPLAPTIREQMAILAQPKLVPMVFIDDRLAHAAKAKIVSPTPHFQKSRGEVAGNTVSERIKDAVSVREFVSQFVELDNRGKGHCPFHDDEHKSFQVRDDGNYWNCYAGCGGGSIIDFWMKWRQAHHEDASFKETVTELARILLK